MGFGGSIADKSAPTRSGGVLWEPVMLAIRVRLFRFVGFSPLKRLPHDLFRRQAALRLGLSMVPMQFGEPHRQLHTFLRRAVCGMSSVMP